MDTEATAPPLAGLLRRFVVSLQRHVGLEREECILVWRLGDALQLAELSPRLTETAARFRSELTAELPSEAVFDLPLADVLALAWQLAQIADLPEAEEGG